MSSFHIRPRFTQVLEMDPESLREQIVNRVQNSGGRFEIKSFPDFVCLRIHQEDRHFWSPRLNLSLAATDDGKTEVKGIYGPNANVWSLFLFSYLIAGFFGFIAAVIGISQWMIGNEPWGFWALGGALTVIVILYLVAQFGQKLGVQQTFLLHQTYESAIGAHAEIH
ncbi:MAG: hypothetical protein KDN20_24380 [Verrucomicrobiae bacterium]|nr:hypothetical protein [Verrucomicrobiae bacterium]